MSDVIGRYQLNFDPFRRSQVAWKYVINLCGQDYPLKTNYDIVKQLQMLYGANNLETITMPGHKKTRWKASWLWRHPNGRCHRYQFVYELPDEKNPYATMKKTETKKSDSPLDAPMFAGSAYFIFSWRAVNFILKGKIIKINFQDSTFCCRSKSQRISWVESRYIFTRWTYLGDTPALAPILARKWTSSFEIWS